MKVWRGLAVLGAMAGVLAGCEGTTTGREVAGATLQAAAARGAYQPAKFNLSTDMNPIAVNFRADFTQEAAEFGKWNSYRAVLTHNGAMVATRNFNVNHPQGQSAGAGGDAPPPTGLVYTLFTTDLQQNGEYELTITPVQPAAITLRNARVDVRANVQRGPQ
jgi:hypothetical protein